MSGWIKLRKTLITDDIRVQRVARKLGVHRMQVVGMLARLWCLADDYADGPDATGRLPHTADEIDEAVGCPGFCAALPADWIEVSPVGEVSLPDITRHNGETAKQRALNARRQARHRERRAERKRPPRTPKKRDTVTGSVTGSVTTPLRMRYPDTDTDTDTDTEDILAFGESSSPKVNCQITPVIACPERLPPQSGLAEKPTEKSEQRAAAAPIAIPLRDGSMWSPAAVDLAAWQAAYPTLDVPAELARLAVWSAANPAKRKTPRGIARCCNSWLSRASERKSSPASPVSRPSGLSFGERLRAKAEEMYGKPPESP